MTVARIDRALCTGCGICVEVCPMDVLREGGDGLPHILYAGDCQSCYLCELRCPSRAILVLPDRAFDPGDVYGTTDVGEHDL